MKTYYTKCGREFQKSSTAGVTGYRIPDGDKQCEKCPFRIAVNEGWPPVFKRWECRAGSLPPNQKDGWRGSLEDKNTIHIQSLHNDFLEAVLEYCKTTDDLGAGYNQDLEDCRRVISVNCSGNKKGIAAKKALVEKFFSIVDASPDKKVEYEECCENCVYGIDFGESVEFIRCQEGKHNKDVRKKQAACAKYISVNAVDNEPAGNIEDHRDELLRKCDQEDCPFNDRIGHCCFAEEEPDSDGYHRDVIGAVDGYECKNEEVLLAYKAITTETVKSQLCIECIFCRRSEKAIDHPAPYKCFRADHRNGLDWYFPADSKACNNFKSSPISCSNCKTDKTTCGAMYPGDYMYKNMKPCNMYTSQMTQTKYIDDKNRLIFVSPGLGGDSYMTMYRDQGWLDKNQGMHRLKSQSLPVRESTEEAQADLDAYAAKKGWEEYVEEKREEVNELRCTKHRCPFNNDEISECGFDPTTDDAHRQQMEEARDQWNCKNSSLLKFLEPKREEVEICEGCAYIHKSRFCNRKGNEREATPETPRCEWYWNVKTDEMGELQYKESYPDGKYIKLSEEAAMELVKPEDRYTENSTPATAFDYSTVDTETATFLQEKEQKITQIRMMSVMAIGKELKEVHDKLANHYQGSFGKWCKSIGISDQTAMNYIRAHEYVAKNFGNIEEAENIQPSLLFAISKPSAPKELQEKVLSGDITSHKQYKEMEEKLKAEKERADSAELREKAREKEKAWEEKKAMDNYRAAQEAQKRAEQAEKALQQLSKTHAASPGEVEELQKQLKEANRQVEILTDELMKPMEVEPAVVEKVPDAVEVELNELRNKVDLRQDYMFVSDMLNMLRVAHHGILRNWAKVIVEENSAAKAGEIRSELIGFGTTIESMIDYLDEEIQMK